MKRWIKVVEVIREVKPEETKNEEIKSNAWEFRAIEIIEEIAVVEGVKPEVGEIVEIVEEEEEGESPEVEGIIDLFLEDADPRWIAEVIEVIREIKPNVWEVKIRWEEDEPRDWLIEGIKPEEGQMLDAEEYVDSLWMVFRPVIDDEKYKDAWVAVRPRFFFEKRLKKDL